MNRETYLNEHKKFKAHCLEKNIDPGSLWGWVISLGSRIDAVEKIATGRAA